MASSAARLLCWALIVTAACTRPAPAAPAPCARVADRQFEPAYPAVSGAIGPLSRVRVALMRPKAVDRGAFHVSLRLPTGRCLQLAGTEDPNQLFGFDVTAVRFVPLRATRGNALVILYNVSQIGPGRGTERAALVYRVSVGPAGRIRTDRRVIDGVASIAQLQRRWGGRR